MIGSLLVVLALGQVTNACGAGKNCTVQSLKTTRTSGNAICVVDQGASLDWSLTSTASSTLAVLGVGKSCGSSVVSPQTWNSSSGAITFGSTFFGTGADRWQTNNGFQASQPFGSFPACSAGLTGRLLFDSTNAVIRVCDGTVWLGSSLIDVSHVDSYFPGAPATLNVATTKWSTQSASLVSVIGGNSYFTPMVVGVGPGNAVWTVHSVSDAVATSTTCTVPCTSAVGTPVACSGTSTFTTSKQLELRLTANGCTTLPAGNFNVKTQAVFAN